MRYLSLPAGGPFPRPVDTTSQPTNLRPFDLAARLERAGLPTWVSAEVAEIGVAAFYLEFAHNILEARTSRCSRLQDAQRRAGERYVCNGYNPRRDGAPRDAWDDPERCCQACVEDHMTVVYARACRYLNHRYAHVTSLRLVKARTLETMATIRMLVERRRVADYLGYDVDDVARSLFGCTSAELTITASGALRSELQMLATELRP